VVRSGVEPEAARPAGAVWTSRALWVKSENKARGGVRVYQCVGRAERRAGESAKAEGMNLRHEARRGTVWRGLAERQLMRRRVAAGAVRATSDLNVPGGGSESDQRRPAVRGRRLQHGVGQWNSRATCRCCNRPCFPRSARIGEARYRGGHRGWLRATSNRTRGSQRDDWRTPGMMDWGITRVILGGGSVGLSSRAFSSEARSDANCSPE